MNRISRSNLRERSKALVKDWVPYFVIHLWTHYSGCPRDAETVMSKRQIIIRDAWGLAFSSRMFSECIWQFLLLMQFVSGETVTLNYSMHWKFPMYNVPFIIRILATSCCPLQTHTTTHTSTNNSLPLSDVVEQCGQGTAVVRLYSHGAVVPVGTPHPHFGIRTVITRCFSRSICSDFVGPQWWVVRYNYGKPFTILYMNSSIWSFAWFGLRTDVRDSRFAAAVLLLINTEKLQSTTILLRTTVQ